MTEGLAQVFVLFSGAVSVWMTQSPRRTVRRWACVVGLLGQPWWIVLAWSTGNWGMLGVSLAITAAWLKGVWRLLGRAVRDRAGTMRPSSNLPRALGEEGSRQ